MVKHTQTICRQIADELLSVWPYVILALKGLKEIFLKNEYPASFIDKCFKTFLNEIFLATSNFYYRKENPDLSASFSW